MEESSIQGSEGVNCVATVATTTYFNIRPYFLYLHGITRISRLEIRMVLIPYGLPDV